MERDIRRDHCQWKGCHSFKNGGLKMGETYFYYYELDGLTETHDPSQPSTTACPYLPGQPVNTLHVPLEKTLRKRSASLGSVRQSDFMTVKPEDKFVAPRAAPPTPDATPFRLATSHVRKLAHKSSTRSLSPTPSWAWCPRRLFSRKASSNWSAGRSSSRCSDVETCSVDEQQRPRHHRQQPKASASLEDEERSARSTSRCDSSRSRDISPDSLRRFLVDDVLPPPSVVEPAAEQQAPSLVIPEDVIEDNDDDDNFATSAQSEGFAFTVLSPPPTQRSFQSSSTLTRLAQEKSRSRPDTPASHLSAPKRAVRKLPLSIQSASSIESSTAFPQSPESTASYDVPSFYHSEDEDDDDYDEEDEGFTLMPLQGVRDNSITNASGNNFLSTFGGYSLPEAAVSDNKVLSAAGRGSNTPNSTRGASRGRNGLLGSAIPSSDMSDLAEELGWMASSAMKA